MNIGSKWLRQAEQAATARAARLIEAAERELGDLLPLARIERGQQEIRIAARGLWRRWIEDPVLRFLWRLK